MKKSYLIVSKGPIAVLAMAPDKAPLVNSLNNLLPKKVYMHIKTKRSEKLGFSYIYIECI
jgi:hypothetical protein